MTGPGASIRSEAEALERVPAVADLAIAALPGMQLGDGSFGRRDTTGSNRGDLNYSARHTAIVLLGLLRAEEHGIEHPFHTGGIRTWLLGDAGRSRLGAGTLGLMLWAESRLAGDAAAELVSLLGDEMGIDGPGPTRGSELAWLVMGLSEMKARERLDSTGRSMATDARAEVMARRRPETGLFQGPGHGPGRRFQSFESEIQTVSALTELNRLEGDGEAAEAAAAAADTLLGVQRDDGSWPALIDVRRGTAVEAHPVTTASQAALAPMALGAVSAMTGDPVYRRAALRGLPWLWGRNELGVAMVDAEAGALYRAIASGDRSDRARLMARAASSLIKAPSGRDGGEGLRLVRDATAADMGWMLEAWAGARSRGALDAGL